MPCSSDREFYEARITRTRELIVAYEDALTALSSGTQSYSLDTGQTRQTVTKANLTEIRNTLASLENRLATLQARLCGGSTHNAPGW